MPLPPRHRAAGLAENRDQTAPPYRCESPGRAVAHARNGCARRSARPSVTAGVVVSARLARMRSSPSLSISSSCAHSAQFPLMPPPAAGLDSADSHSWHLRCTMRAARKTVGGAAGMRITSLATRSASRSYSSSAGPMVSFAWMTPDCSRRFILRLPRSRCRRRTADGTAGAFRLGVGAARRCGEWRRASLPSRVGAVVVIDSSDSAGTDRGCRVPRE